MSETRPADVPEPTGLADALVGLAFAQAEDPVLAEIELAADATGEPVPDRATATFVTWALRAVGATRVVELGAGGGGLSWWLAGAVGAEGELHVVTGATDGQRLYDRLRRAGRSGQVTVHTVEDTDAEASPEHLSVVEGDLDAVVIAEVTPHLTEAWDAVVTRLRPGGVVVVGGVLTDGLPAGRTAAVVREALEDPELWTSIVPLGRGLLVALKARSDLAGGATDRLW